MRKRMKKSEMKNQGYNIQNPRQLYYFWSIGSCGYSNYKSRDLRSRTQEKSGLESKVGCFS